MANAPKHKKDVGMRATRRRLAREEAVGLGCVALVAGILLLFLILDSTGVFLYQQNEFVVWALFFVGLLAASEGGYWLGRRARVRVSDAIKTHANEIQAAVFAVLGLLLAFTFTMSVARYDSRKLALAEETSAIDTAYLRVQLLPQPQQSAEVALFPKYVDVRLASGSANGSQEAEMRRQTHELQRQMWAAEVTAASQDPHALPTQLFIQALNDAFDAQSRRDAARQNYVPGSALYLLFIASILAMGMMGYRSGLGGGQAIIGVVLLALLLTLVVLIILDLDHPYQGLITISQQSLHDLRQRMGNG